MSCQESLSLRGIAFGGRKEGRMSVSVERVKGGVFAALVETCGNSNTGQAVVQACSPGRGGAALVIAATRTWVKSTGEAGVVPGRGRAGKNILEPVKGSHVLMEKGKNKNPSRESGAFHNN